MNTSRRLGILIFFAVPAIVGGGILYGLFQSWMPVIVYEALLLALAGVSASR